MTNREYKLMRQTGCMTFKRAVRTAKRIARSTGKTAGIYQCGRTANCYKVSTKRPADTWCNWHANVRPRR